jgi:hypothetical protein
VQELPFTVIDVQHHALDRYIATLG